MKSDKAAEFALEVENGYLAIRPKGALSEAIHTHLTRAVRKPSSGGRYDIQPRHVVPLLRTLSPHGRITFQGRPLVLNLFSSIACAQGQLTIRDAHVSIDECVLGRGFPNWFLHRGCLRLLDEEVEWSDLTQRPSQQIEAWPVLQLTDRHGAFANLLLDDRTNESEWEADLLETDYERRYMGNSHYYCPTDRVAKALTFLLEVGWKVIDHKGREVQQETDFRVIVAGNQRSLVVRGHAQYADHRANLPDLVGAFNRHERFVELGEGRVGLLADRSRLAPFADGTLEEEAVRLPKCRLGRFLDLDEIAIDPCLREATLAPLGTDFQGTLRPYQQLGVNWLAYLYEQGFNGFLADDMGLGKTVQVIAFLSRLPLHELHLIVAPTSLLFNWRRELERFLPTAHVTVHHGSQRKTDLQGVILTSYGTLRSDRELLQSIPFHTVTLDEAQQIKNPRSETARAACGLRTGFRLSLSGTPVENRSEELWAHFRFLMPELLGERVDFQARVLADQVRGEIRPFILRRTKEEVAPELPEKVEQLIEIEMLPDQRAVYEELLSSTDRRSRMDVLELILRLRQVCSHPLLIGKEAQGAKLERLLEDLDTLVSEGRKVLVYSQFASMLHLIGRELSHPHLLLEGKTRNREQIVDQFQTDPDLPIFLVSLKAGGVGLNLTVADTVILYDPWWNDAVEQQAVDRAHRIGQQQTVMVKRFILTGSIEEKILRLKAHKRALGDQLLGDTGLTESELRELIG